jgi:PKD repeat protein
MVVRKLKLKKIKIMKIYNIKSLAIVLWLFALVLSACSPNENGLRKNEGDVDPSLLPDTDFTASATSIFQFETINFSPTTINEGDLYTWSFPGGSPGTSIDPTVEVKYTVRGTYPVSLKIRNDFGAKEEVREDYIIVEGEPLDPAVRVRFNFEQNLFEEYSETVATGALSGYETGVVNDFAGTFNGSGLTINGYNGITGNNPRTVAVWIKSTTTARSGIATWGAPGTFSRNTFCLAPGGKLRFEYQGGGLNATVVADGTWHHVAYTYDGQQIAMYVDGVLEATQNQPSINTGVAGDRQITIGSEGTSDGSLDYRVYIGAMDNFILYNRALTEEEIAELAQL